MVALAPSFVVGRVMHRRLLPRVHSFDYGMFYLSFALSQINGIRNKLLSIDRFNLMSLYRRDHGARDGTDLTVWAQKILQDHGCAACDGEIVLLTLPRFLGYVFNPVSFWFCHNAAGELLCVISEVNNTFGESHCYLAHHDDFAPITGDNWFTARKVFHVSPFLNVTGGYRFRFGVSGERVVIHINLYEGDELRLVTSVTGDRKPVTGKETLRLAILFPLITIKTILLIHFEALRLWLKGMKYYPKPPPPAEKVSR